MIIGIRHIRSIAIMLFASMALALGLTMAVAQATPLGRAANSHHLAATSSIAMPGQSAQHCCGLCQGCGDGSSCPAMCGACGPGALALPDAADLILPSRLHPTWRAAALQLPSGADRSAMRRPPKTFA
jgi:hypothetical protein